MYWGRYTSSDVNNVYTNAVLFRNISNRISKENAFFFEKNLACQTDNNV